MTTQPVPLAPDPPAQGWVRLRALVLAGVSSPHSRRVYANALDEFGRWCEQHHAYGFTRETVQHYRAYLEARELAPSSLNLHLTVIRRLAREAAANGLLSAEAAMGVASVQGARRKGQRLGTWLTLDQAVAVLKAPTGNGLRARRDRALLALLIGCGLRRSELVALTPNHIQIREGRWVIVDLEGKGNRLRSIPMPAWAHVRLQEWCDAGGIRGGRLFRSISQGGEVGEALTAQAVYLIVRGYSAVAPHDLRRTFAQLAHRGHAPLEQIQLSLGHDSILTTERYLGVRQNLADAPCDCLGITGESYIE